jgi:hypothetical protein
MAIGRSIGRITADLELRTAQFQKGIEKVERQTRQVNTKMSKAFSGASRSVGILHPAQCRGWTDRGAICTTIRALCGPVD